jgi:hypothetical protein
VIVKKLLEKNEYEECEADNEQINNRGMVRGRGEWHQIDALGRWKYSIPFVYPIRLLCEAKCWNQSVGLPVVRNFVGAIKDISENYFVEDNQDIDKRMLSKRHTDCGAIFSVSGFTNKAQRYAYAQNIFLVSYENNPIIDEFKRSVEDVAQFIRLTRRANKKEFSRWFEDAWTRNYMGNSDRYFTDRGEFENSLKTLRDRFERVSTSVVGIATSVYPIHLLSSHKIPYDLFRQTDEVYFRTTYRRTERGGHYFEIFPSDLPNITFSFTVPEVILSKYRDSMSRFKMDFLEWIDVPVTLGSIRRLLRFKLDKEWLRSVDEHNRGQRESNPQIKGLIDSL